MIGNTAPASHAAAITPHNTNNLANATRGIYVGGAGNLKVDMIGGEAVTFTALAVGVIHPIAAIKVYSTGTTCTGIVGVW